MNRTKDFVNRREMAIEPDDLFDSVRLSESKKNMANSAQFMAEEELKSQPEPSEPKRNESVGSRVASFFGRLGGGEGKAEPAEIEEMLEEDAPSPVAAPAPRPASACD